jgi:hypothetical protein
MKRDMDLIRQILLRIEEKPYDMGFFDVEVEGHTESDISYHVMLLAQAGYIQAQNLSTGGGPSWKPISLTWQGHEFLEAAKNTNIWNKAKSLLKDKTGGVVFEILKQLLIEMAKAQVGLAPQP